MDFDFNSHTDYEVEYNNINYFRITIKTKDINEIYQHGNLSEYNMSYEKHNIKIRDEGDRLEIKRYLNYLNQQIYQKGYLINQVKTPIRIYNHIYKIETYWNSGKKLSQFISNIYNYIPILHDQYTAFKIIIKNNQIFLYCWPIFSENHNQVYYWHNKYYYKYDVNRVSPRQIITRFGDIQYCWSKSHNKIKLKGLSFRYEIKYYKHYKFIETQHYNADQRPNLSFSNYDKEIYRNWSDFDESEGYDIYPGRLNWYEVALFLTRYSLKWNCITGDLWQYRYITNYRTIYDYTDSNIYNIYDKINPRYPSDENYSIYYTRPAILYNEYDDQSDGLSDISSDIPSDGLSDGQSDILSDGQSNIPSDGLSDGQSDIPPDTI